MHKMESEVDFTSPAPEGVPINDTRTIFLPVSEEILKHLKIGDSVHVKFDAIVAELSDGYNDDAKGDIGLKTQRVTIETENEFEELSRDE